MGWSEISDILWRERQLLELLAFKLEEAQLVLRAGTTRWFNLANRELEMVIQELKEAELERAIEVQALGVELGLVANTSLRQLAERAPQPWDAIFIDHRDAFLMAPLEIIELAEANKQLLREAKGQSRVDSKAGDDHKIELNIAGADYVSSDVDLSDEMMRLQLEEIAYKAALSANATVLQPSLVDFLR